MKKTNRNFLINANFTLGTCQFIIQNKMIEETEKYKMKNLIIKHLKGKPN